jgi:tetratricopeptide (TPR) repeat protein
MLDQRVASLAGLARRPPTLEAYQEFAAGLEKFWRGRRLDARENFNRAQQLDTAFTLPLIFSVYTYPGSAGNPQWDSAVAVLVARRDRLGPLDQVALDYFQALQSGDTVASNAAIRRGARLAPGSEWSYNAAVIALQFHRPREALAHLSTLDPEHGWPEAYRNYWVIRARAHHIVGEHGAELNAVRSQSSVGPGEILALLGLRELEEAQRILEDRLVASPFATNQALIAIAGEAHVHGSPEQAQDVLALVEGWLRSPAATERPASPNLERSNVVLALQLGGLLYLQGRWDEAEDIFEVLLEADPALVPARAYLGLIAAKRGNRAEAESILHSLEGEEFDWEGLTIHPQLIRAQLAAVLGERERAMEYLARDFGAGSLSEGMLALHRQADFHTLRGYPPFEAYIRPRG